MSNAQIILQTKGNFEKYLTIDPEHTFFKTEYKTHTQYGSSWLVLSNNDRNRDNFIQPGTSLYFRIPPDGDILTESHLRFKLDISGGNAWKASSFSLRETLFGILDTVQFMANDKVLAEMDSEFIFSWFELNLDYSNKKTLADTISYDNVIKTLENRNPTNKDEVYLSIPLPFWFHKNPNNGFPLWSLTEPNVGIKVTLKNYTTFPNVSNDRKIKDIELVNQFCYLNQEEKEKFKSLPLEYIIEQPELVEHKVVNSSKLKIQFPQTHFIKYIFWNIKDTSNNTFLYKNDINKVSLSFNGNILIDTNHPKYFYLVENYKSFKSCGSLNLDSEFRPQEGVLNPIYTYAFSLEPLHSKVSGFLTSDKFNNFTLDLDFGQTPQDRICNVYIVKHNILRIKNGNLNMLIN